jgi:hypothetical protein
VYHLKIFWGVEFGVPINSIFWDTVVVEGFVTGNTHLKDSAIVFISDFRLT